MKTNALLIALVGIIVIGGFGYMLFFRTPSQPVDTTEDMIHESHTRSSVLEETVPETIDTNELNQSTVKEVTVVGSNYAFSPGQITVKKGDTVRITFKNTGGNHDFVIDEFNVATKQIGDGQEATIEFIATEAGSFEYYCSVGSHRAMGMKGVLVVEE